MTPSETVSNIITRQVVVNRVRTPKEEATVYFFKLGRFISDDDLEKEYNFRGLKPADPYLLEGFNRADPTFSDEHPNGTHWKDVGKGKWCRAAFSRWSVGRGVDVLRRVNVDRYGDGWGVAWWFAGLRK